MLAHAFGAVFDNPDLIVVAVVGDGEAETGPLEGSWKGISFLNPVRDGAVLPILHLNGYKISGPTVLGRDARRGRPKAPRRPRLRGALRRGRRPAAHAPGVRRDARHVLREASAPIQTEARARTGFTKRPRWPAIVLRTPEGLDRARRSSTACRSRARSAPTRCRSPTCRTTRSISQMLEAVDAELPARGTLRRSTAGSSPSSPRSRPRATGAWAPTRTPTAASSPWTSTCPTSATTRSPSRSRPPSGTNRRASSARCCATSSQRTANPKNFRLFCPDETNSNRLGDVFEVENRCSVGDDHPDRRPRGRRRPRDGGAQRAPLPGLARGLRPDRTARPLRHLRGVRDGRRRR